MKSKDSSHGRRISWGVTEILSMLFGMAASLAVLVSLAAATRSGWSWRDSGVMTWKTLWWVLGLVVIVATIVGLKMWHHHRAFLRGFSRVPLAYTMRITPPPDLTPGMAAWLLNGKHRVVLAILADLVNRGHITVSTSPDKGDDCLWKLSPVTKKSDHLRPHERDFMYAVFGKGINLYLPRDGDKLRRSTKQDALYQDLIRSGLVPVRRPTPLFVLVYFLIGTSFSVWLFLMHLGVGLLWFWGTVAFIVVISQIGRYMPPVYGLTTAGEAAVREIQEFGLYLDTAEVGQLKWDTNFGTLVGYVPWALAMGRVKLWTEWTTAQRRSSAGDPTDLSLFFSYLHSLEIKYHRGFEDDSGWRSSPAGRLWAALQRHEPPGWLIVVAVLVFAAILAAGVSST